MLSAVLAWAPRMAALWLKPILWYNAYGNILIEYTSPSMVLAAIALLGGWMFSSMREYTIQLFQMISQMGR